MQHRLRHSGSLGYRIGTSGGSVAPAWTPSTAEYAAVLAAKVTEPSLADKIAEDAAMKSLVDGGYFTKAELLDFMCCDTPENSLFNWKNPALFKPAIVDSNGTYDPTNVNEMEDRHRPYMGFQGSIYSQSSIRLNFIPATDATIISQNNICVIIGISSDDRSTDVFGSYPITSRRLNILPRYTTADTMY